MSSYKPLIQIVLVALSALGFYGTWYLGMNNGFFDQLNDVLSPSGPRFLPGTKALIKADFTGITALDELLAKLNTVFWPAVDGSMPHVSLHTFDLCGQYAAFVGIAYVESVRAGNRGRIVSFISIWGILMQNVAYTVIAPLYLAFHLATSSTLSATKSSIIADTADLSALPFSLSIGFILPAIMSALPSPSVQTFEQKQNFLAIWQAFPVFVTLSQQILQRVIAVMFPASSRNRAATNLKTLRAVYLFLIGTAITTHIAAGTLIQTNKLLPGLFAPEFTGAFGFAKVALPATFTPAVKMTDVGSGILLFLQYDELIGSSAVLIWALYTYNQAGAQTRSLTSWLSLLLGTAPMVALGGPIGAAVALMWVRDEKVLNNGSLKDKKSK